MVQQIQTLEEEINRLRGEVEVQNHAIEQLKRRQRDLYTDIDRRMQRVESPATTTLQMPVGEVEPPLQTLSPFPETARAGDDGPPETSLTLELVDQDHDQYQNQDQDRYLGPTGAGEDIVPLSSPSEQAPQPVSDPELAGDALTAAQDMALSDTPQDVVAGAPEQAPAASDTAEGVVAEAPAAVDPALIEATYRHAFDLLKQSRYDPAIKAFREFLARYPGSDHAANAQFWLAEAYYVNSRFGQALVEYSALAQRYPDSPKLAQATLKAAFCQHEMGQVDAARRQLDDIIQQYPGTAVASLAQDRLQVISAQAAADNSADDPESE